MKLIKTGELIRVCDECDAIWCRGRVEDDLPTYLAARGLPPLWNQLVAADTSGH